MDNLYTGLDPVLPPDVISTYTPDTTWYNKYQGMLGASIVKNNKDQSLLSQWESGFFMDKDIFKDYRMPQSTFDPDKEGLGRFQASEAFDNVGFIQGRDNEELYGQLQSIGDIINNAFSQMWGLTKYQFKDQLAGWGRLFDFNPVGDDMEELNKGLDEIMNKNPIFMTEANKNSTFNWAKFGNIIGQSGFTLGAAGEILFEELVLTGANVLSGGALTGVQSARTAQLTGKIANIFSRRVGEALKEVNRISEAALDVNKVKNVYARMAQKASKYIPFSNTLEFAGKGLKSGETALSATSRGFGAFYRDLREANAVFTEARAGSAGTYVELKEQLADEFYRKNGRDADYNELQKQDRVAKEAANANFISNAIIIGASNKIQFDNLFKGFKGVNKFMGEAGEILQDSKGFFKKVLGLRSAKAMLKTAPLTYFKDNITEGLQESFQNISNETAKRWYSANYFNPESKTVLQSVKEGVQSQVSQEGLDTFLAGFVTGAIAGPIQGGSMWLINRASTSKAQRQARKTKRDDQIIRLNQYFTYGDKRNLPVQLNLANKMAEAVRIGDKKTFQDIKDESLRSFVRTGIETNKIDVLFDQLETSIENLGEKEFIEAYGVDSDKKNILASIGDMRNKAEDIKNIKEQLDFKYPTNYSDNVLPSAKAYEEAKWHITFMQHSLKRVKKRQDNLLNELKANSELKDISYLDFQRLADKKQMEKEINFLQQEVKNAVDAKTRSQKEKKLKILEKIMEGKLTPDLFKAYFKVSTEVPVSLESISSAYETITDYTALHEDEMDLVHNLNYLADPNNVMTLIKSHETIQEKVVPQTPLPETTEDITAGIVEPPLEIPLEVKGEVRTGLLDTYARQVTEDFSKHKEIHNKLFTGENAPNEDGDILRNEEEKQYLTERKIYWKRVQLYKEKLEKIYNNLDESTTLDGTEQDDVEEAQKLNQPDLDRLIKLITDKIDINQTINPESPVEVSDEVTQGGEYADVYTEKPVEVAAKDEPVIVPQPTPKPEPKSTGNTVYFSSIKSEIKDWETHKTNNYLDESGKPIVNLEFEDYAHFVNDILRNLYVDGLLGEYGFKLFKDNPSFYDHSKQEGFTGEKFEMGTYTYEGERKGLVIFLTDKLGKILHFDKNGREVDENKGNKVSLFLPSAAKRPDIKEIREALEKQLETKDFIDLNFIRLAQGGYDERPNGQPWDNAYEFLSKVSTNNITIEDGLGYERVEDKNGKASLQLKYNIGKGLNPIYLYRNKRSTLHYEDTDLSMPKLFEYLKEHDFDEQRAKDIIEYLSATLGTDQIHSFVENGRYKIVVPESLQGDGWIAFEKKYFPKNVFFVHYVDDKGNLIKRKTDFRKFLLQNSSTNKIPVKTKDGKLTITSSDTNVDFSLNLPKYTQKEEDILKPEVKEKIVTLPQDKFDKIVPYLESKGVIIEKICK